jgi:hypothetical protein
MEQAVEALFLHRRTATLPDRSRPCPSSDHPHRFDVRMASIGVTWDALQEGNSADIIQMKITTQRIYRTTFPGRTRKASTSSCQCSLTVELTKGITNLETANPATAAIAPMRADCSMKITNISTFVSPRERNIPNLPDPSQDGGLQCIEYANRTRHHG